MPIEFLGIAGLNDGGETQSRSGASFDKDYTLRFARAHEDNGWDRILFAYHAGSPDPATAAAFIASKLDHLKILLAHRPNVSYPTYAAKVFATLDQISDGRLNVHFITGGSTADQAAEGDHLTKDERYERTGEYIQIVKRAWTERTPFSHDGKFYKFENFVSDIWSHQHQHPRPQISFGGSSPAAYAIGAAEADIYAVWGEPLVDTAEQIRTITDAAAAAGRAERPRIQAAFRPIIAATDELAWEKANGILGRIESHIGAYANTPFVGDLAKPENAGSQRLLEIAGKGDRYDRALWTKPAAVSGGRGNSNALVGSPETVAAALLDYVDLGVDILSARGYDFVNDTIDFGRYVIPIVREEVARRDAEAAKASAAAAEETAREEHHRDVA